LEREQERSKEIKRKEKRKQQQKKQWVPYTMSPTPMERVERTNIVMV